MSLMTPDKNGIKFPVGYILVNEKWRGEALVQEISRKTKVSYSDAAGFIDFFLTQDCPVLYFSETDLSTKLKECKEKISKLCSMSKRKGIVIAVWNSKVLLEFNEIQEYATLNEGVPVIPVLSQSELPILLHKLAVNELTTPRKPKKRNSASHTQEQISLLTKIPGIKVQEAQQLLDKFGNIISITEASKESLKCCLGERLAMLVWKFFNQPIT